LRIDCRRRGASRVPGRRQPDPLPNPESGYSMGTSLQRRWADRRDPVPRSRWHTSFVLGAVSTASPLAEAESAVAAPDESDVASGGLDAQADRPISMISARNGIRTIGLLGLNSNSWTGSRRSLRCTPPPDRRSLAFLRRPCRTILYLADYSKPGDRADGRHHPARERSPRASVFACCAVLRATSPVTPVFRVSRRRGNLSTPR
jgi:hypothetical protein